MDETLTDIGPETELFIYYLQGRVARERLTGLPGFVGNWEEDGFSFLFFSRPAVESVCRIVADGAGDTRLLDQFQMTYADWQGGDISAIRSARLTIRPPWVPAESSGATAEVVLDPGVVFGNGNHATTRASLAAIDFALSCRRVETALDLGTGTGVLALAAARLGCRRVVAVDSNRLACETTRKNVCRNRLEDHVLVVQARAEEFVGIEAQLLIANIHYAIMRRIVASPGFLRARQMVLSGLMRTEARAIRDAVLQYPLRIVRYWDEGGIWCTFYLERDPL